MGLAGTSSTPIIDFHSGSGATNIDYDTRILSAGGAASTSGGGQLQLFAAQIRPSGSIIPTGDNTTQLGQAANRFSTGYFASNIIVGSDARIKDDIRSLSMDKWLRFLQALKPVSFRYKDADRPAIMETQRVKRHKTREVDVDDFIESIVDGKRVMQRVIVKKHVPIGDPLPVLDVDGSPFTRIESTFGTTDGTERASRVMGPKPMTMDVPVFEEKEESFEIFSASRSVHNRNHIGFTAQDVREALSKSGLEDKDDDKRSIWAIFVYDEPSDLFMLRYEQFVAALVIGWQSHEDRLQRLERAIGLTTA